MAVFTYEDVVPTLIPNTTMTKTLRDGVPTLYRIYPIEGYVLHNNVRDWTGIDPETMEETFYRGYSTSYSSVPASYDFTQTTTIDGYTAYGNKEIFARPASEVPADQIFGGGDNDHVVA